MTDLHHILKSLNIDSSVETTKHYLEPYSYCVFIHLATTDFFIVPVFVCILDYRSSCSNDLYILREMPEKIVSDGTLGSIRRPVRESSICSWENYRDLGRVTDWLQASRATVATKLLMP